MKKGYIDLEEWKKKAKKLKKTYLSIEAMEEHCRVVFADHFSFEFNKDIIAVYPYHFAEKDDRFHNLRDGAFYARHQCQIKKLDMEEMVDATAEVLKKHLNKKEFLMDALYDLQTEDMLDIFDRAVLKKGKVSAKPGCYKFLIGGLPGSPSEFMLRE